MAEDNLVVLAAGADQGIVDVLSESLLAPFDDVPEVKRQTLLDTLQVWLLVAGDRAAAARALHVHPQTVSYRVGRLRALIGAELDDPYGRLGWQILLAARQGLPDLRD